MLSDGQHSDLIQSCAADPSAMSNPLMRRQSIMCTFLGELSHAVAVGNVSALIASFNIPETHCQGGY